MAADLIAFKSIFPSPFGYAYFGESNRELNKQLIEDIETHRSKYDSEERTFRGNDNSWQSETGLEKIYSSFEKLRRQIDQASKPILKHSGCREETLPNLKACNLWSNVIFDVGGFSFPHVHPTHMSIWTGVYYPHGAEYEDLNKFVDIILKEIEIALNKNERVELRDIFTLETKIQKARMSRNPKTNEKIETKEKKSIKFKMSKEWFKKINEKI